MPKFKDPVKGDKNPITLILEEAADLVLNAERELFEEYGIPLFTTVAGKGPSALRWPDDPETMSPEEMQVLLNLHGKDKVVQWLMEESMRKMAESTMSPDGEDGRAGS